MLISLQMQREVKDDSNKYVLFTLSPSNQHRHPALASLLRDYSTVFPEEPPRGAPGVPPDRYWSHHKYWWGAYCLKTIYQLSPKEIFVC